jgi:hypothetical protein
MDFFWRKNAPEKCFLFLFYFFFWEICRKQKKHIGGGVRSDIPNSQIGKKILFYFILFSWRFSFVGVIYLAKIRPLFVL